MTALESILSQEIVQRLGWTLIHFVRQAAAIALLLAISLAALRKASAGLRYTVSCLALGLVVLLPVVTIRLVPVSVAEPPAGPQPAPPPVVLAVEQVKELPVSGVEVVETPVGAENVSPDPGVPWRERVSMLLEPALPHVVSCWLIGVLALSIWHLGGWTQLQRLRKRMVRPMDAALRAKLDNLSARLGVKRAVRLTESALVQIPTVVGWLRPVILLPASALTGLTPEQLEAILAHELAHIRRHDYLVNMLQAVVETLGFYHPAVWWVSHKIRTERENCCDDLAVGISGSRIAYARALASMEEIRSAHSDLAVAASGGNLFSRIRRLLGKEPSDSSRASWIPSAIAILLMAAIAVPITLALPDDNVTEYSAQSAPDNVLVRSSRSETPDPNEPQKLFITDGQPDVTPSEGTPYSIDSVNEGFELGRDIPVDLDAGPDGMRTIVRVRSIRFEKADSNVRATLQADVRGGLIFEWKTGIELLGDGGEVLARRDSLNKARSLISGQLVIEERLIEFELFEWDEVASARRFRLSLDQIGALRDEIGRPYDDTRTDWIRGCVTGPDGLPVDDAIVLINEHRPNGGPFSVPRVGTDEKGSYKFGAVDWPYRLGVERRQRLNSTNVHCYQVIFLEQIFNGPQTVDFKFDEPPEGTASLVGKVADAGGVPIRQFKANVMEYSDSEDMDFESADDGRRESVWYDQQVNNADGEFRLENVPAGEYRIRISPKEKQYERHFQQVVLTDGKTTNLTLTIPSKHVLYGRVLFEDGSPAVLQPAPWPGAETRILLPIGSRARGVATVEQDGYFTVYLDEAELERLKSGSGQLIINVPTAQQGRSTTVGKFPFDLLSPQKNKAGVVKVNVPLNMEQLRPRILTLENSDPVQMAGLLTTLFAAEGAEGVKIYEVILGKDAEEKRKTFGPLSDQFKFEDVPGAKKIIVISKIPEAYVGVEKLVLELDKQNMATKDVKQVREWIDRFVSGPQILIETRILEATDEFLKANWLDANSVRQGEIHSARGHAFAGPAVEPYSLPYVLLFDDRDVNLLLTAMAAAPEGKGARVRAAPQVLAVAGEPVTMKTVTELAIPSSGDPNDSPGKAESKPQYVEVGTSIKITANTLPDSNNVRLDFDWELSQVRGYKQHVGPDGKKQEFPIIVRETWNTVALVPDGKTLLMGGKKISRWGVTRTKQPLLGDLPVLGSLFRSVSIVEDTQNVLILIKPTVNPQEELLPTLPPVDHNDPLVERLQNKLERSAAPG